MEIKPDRTNWKQFCKEPPLTEDEIATWNEMARAIQQDDSLFDFIEDETEAEWQRAYSLKPSTDWLSVVEWADANRALQRAEIKAYQKWKRRIMFNQTTPAYRDQDLRSFTGPDPEPIEAATEILRPGGKLCYWGKEANHDQ